jgi:glycosyltransferase
MKKISIITISYNCKKTLADTINSVNSQTARKEIEYIIIDGQSTDGTTELIKQNEDKIDHWLSEPDKGIYDAMNKGIKLATGEWVGFLHADDLYTDTHVVEKIIQHIDNKDTNALYGNLNYIQAEPPHKVIRYWKSQDYKPVLLKRGWMPAHPTLYIKKDHFNKVGNFNTQYKIAADYDLILRLFSHPETKASFMDTTMVNMRVGGVSNNSIGNIIQKSKEDYQALKSNNIGGIGALFVKNFSKLIQFVTR